MGQKALCESIIRIVLQLNILEKQLKAFQPFIDTGDYIPNNPSSVNSSITRSIDLDRNANLVIKYRYATPYKNGELQPLYADYKVSYSLVDGEWVDFHNVEPINVLNPNPI